MRIEIGLDLIDLQRLLRLAKPGAIRDTKGCSSGLGSTGRLA